METRQDAKRFLKQYGNIQQKLIVLNYELEEAYADCGVGSVELTGMPSGSNGRTSSNERISFKRISLIEKIKALKETYDDTLVEVITVINSIDDPCERELLALRYLKLMKWEDIASTLHYSWQHTHRIHKQALNDVIECYTKFML